MRLLVGLTAEHSRTAGSE